MNPSEESAGSAPLGAKPALSGEARDVAETLLALLWDLLTASKPIDTAKVEREFEAFYDIGSFKKIVQLILDLRDMSSFLNRGDLNAFVYSKGYILANLKALQSNLRHLTWQTKKIASGDFNQKVDFMGDFSESFNLMTLKLRNFNNELQQQANYDSLTKVPNRLFLDHFLAKTFEKFTASGEVFSIIMFDLDFFKKVNDNYGHDAGDKALVQISEILREQFRSTDVFARYGGEEFMAVLPGAPWEIACKTAERARVMVRETPISVSGEISLNLTISSGISQSRAEDKEYAEVTKRADDALYAAKESGRDRVVVG